MNNILAPVAVAMALVSIITPASILISAHFQRTAVESGNVDRFFVAVKFPEVVVIVSSISMMIYAVNHLNWWLYLLITWMASFVAVAELALFTADVDQWTDLRETYLFHEGEGDWIEDWADDSS